MTTGLADLHRHLDGSLRPSTVSELAQRLGLPVPAELAFHPGMGLAEALQRFVFTLSLLREPAAVRRVAAEICQDAAAEGVTTLEIRFAPQLHPGGSLEEIIEAAVEGAAGRAGILLCVLYGDPPATAEALVRAAIRTPGVVGLDLAGGPVPGDSFGMADYARAFGWARDAGLGRTVHAGEGRPPSEIRAAIELLHAQRIGHGTSLLEDPAVTELVLQRGVTLEACPTSNLHTGAIPSVEAHPLPRWLALGIKACVCSDNTLLSQVTASSELRLVSALPGIGPEQLQAVVAHGHAAAFSRRSP